ncbi:MAG TPA: flagellar hook protein FlgE [Acetobacteraceae bacterium]|nr:flagellar hook protein FlgE [Acetobacteraceae bacterium]
MSLFGAMNTAVSGLSAESAEFANISDNVANSQTVGYKGVDTNFIDYLTSSTPEANDPSTVVALPGYTNTIQGTITQTSNPLNLAISGQGFFAVSDATSTTGTTTSFSPEQYYTQAGDFSMNSQGYLVNSAGYYLDGWSVDPTTGTVDQNALTPIQVSQTAYAPVATSEVDLAANLPATPSSTTPITSQVQVYDALGNQQTVDLTWTQTGTDTWTVDITAPDATNGPDLGTATVDFGPTASGNAVADGTVGNVSVDAADPGTLTTSTYAANSPASISFTADFGNGNQTIALNLGDYGASNGLTQYAGTSYTLNNLSQNGVPPGAFSSVTISDSGDVTINYNNGESQTIAQVPVVTFNAPDQLQSQNGQAFTATQNSGDAIVNSAGTGGSGSLVTSAVEDSNVDLSSEFSQLIVAQEAYSANTKTISTASQMVQSLLNIIQ